MKNRSFSLISCTNDVSDESKRDINRWRHPATSKRQNPLNFQVVCLGYSILMEYNFIFHLWAAKHWNLQVGAICMM